MEIIDGREFVVTHLPPDKRSTPSATKKRTLFQSLPSGSKHAVIRARIAQAKKRKKRKRSRHRKKP